MKVLVLTGPESSGKSWLAEQLQARFGGRVVGEYVRHFIDEQRRDTCYADIPAIARGQLAWEDAARAERPALLILDTHLLSNILWSRILFGDCRTGSNPPCCGGATTCTCCSRRKAWPGAPTASAASRNWRSARPSTANAKPGWSGIGSPTAPSPATGPSAGARLSPQCKDCSRTAEGPALSRQRYTASTVRPLAQSVSRRRRGKLSRR